MEVGAFLYTKKFKKKKACWVSHYPTKLWHLLEYRTNNDLKPPFKKELHQRGKKNVRNSLTLKKRRDSDAQISRERKWKLSSKESISNSV